MKRRNFLQFAVLAGALSSLARSAFAWPTAAFKAEKPQGALSELFGDIEPVASDAVKFKAPEIAENGAVVPVTVEYDGPETVKRIAILVEENPQPLAAAFEISPKALAHASTRIKMRTSSNVTALVQTADGKLFSAAREVKVTIGGCGG